MRATNGQVPEPTVLHEDSDIVVLNKPAGMAVHAGAGVRAESPLTEWLVAHYPDVRGVGESDERPGLVHRLDADTSGVMVVARTVDAYAALKQSFKTREVDKTYVALIEGSPTWSEQTIDLAIRRGGHGLFVARHPRDVATLPPAEQAEYRSAISDVHVREQLGDYTLIDVHPHTGRTHQIRVHLRAIGHPVVGDKLYAPALARKKAVSTLGLERQFLHAARLEFTHPHTGKRVHFEAALPPDLQQALERARLQSANAAKA